MEPYEINLSALSPYIDSIENVNIYPEKKFMFAIIERAVEDLKYLKLDCTKEQKSYARSAVLWLFVERYKEIEDIYPGFNEQKTKRIRTTSFENLCHWLNIDPNLIRQGLCAKPEYSFLAMFV